MSESKSDDLESVCSNFSIVSLANGEEVSAEQALDEGCKDIQTAINEIHSFARQLLMGDERDDNYEEMIPLFKQLDENISEGIVLLKDLKKICKQLIPKKPRAATKKKEPSMLDVCK